MKVDEKLYHILVIEDNPGDFVIVEELLVEQLSRPDITHAINYKEARAILETGRTFDIILLDLSLPDKEREPLIRSMMEISSGHCPIIILTGYTNIDFSIRSISLGISDYLLKDELNGTMLYKSMIYAIERKESLSLIKRSEKRYSDLFNLSPQPMWVFDEENFEFVQVNKAAIALYGYSEAEFLSMTLLKMKPEEDIPAAILELKKPKRGLVYKTLTRHLKKSGDTIEVELYTTPLVVNGKNCRSVIAIDKTEINQYNNKITRAIITTQEDERYEIGGELHDNVCQILAASQFSLGRLGAAVPQEHLVLLDQCKEHIRMALDEIRNLSHRLAPAFFDGSSLEEAFITLFNTFNANEYAEILLHFDDSVKKHTISLEIQLNLYRILQEQLRNILKYAKATLVEVSVVVYNGKLKMQVTDNGVGFNMDAVKKGIGIANMKRRAELFSGEFSLDSSPGAGCTIMINIPL